MAAGDRQRTIAQTRQAILSAAMSLFLGQGFHATSMRQISVQAGVSLGAAYNHFSGKQEIFRHLVSLHNPFLVLAHRLQKMEEEATAIDLEMVLRETTSLLHQHADFIRLAMIDILEFHGTSLGEAAADGVPIIYQFFQRLAERGQASGSFRAISPALLMRAVVALSIHSVVLDELNWPVRDLLPAEDWVDGFTDLLGRGILLERVGKQNVSRG